MNIRQFPSLLFIIMLGFLGLVGCHNRPLQDNSKLKPREIHQDIEFHFDAITVDGVEYLILEKDNNNPHEGFGFMAFRANKMIEKQDTLLAYMRTITQMQALIYAKTYKKSITESQDFVGNLYQENLEKRTEEIYMLKSKKLSNKD